MKDRFRDSSNKSIFPMVEQNAIINSNQELIDVMKTATNMEEWNLMRRRVTSKFVGSDMEMVMLFGYIDGVLFVEQFKKD
jgi:hypothetical protein